MGSPDAKLYGPDYLVNRNVIVVTISYRLGCLGKVQKNYPIHNYQSYFTEINLLLNFRRISQS